MAQVHLRGVKKSYDNKLEVIHGIDMEIADGEFIVIVGPSGCGKSTLLRMVAGLERITGGEVAIGDRVVNELEPKDRDIAMVFQNYALYPHMSVYDNMAYGLKIRGMPKDEIDQRVRKAAKILELGHVPASASRASSRAASASASPWAAPSCASPRCSCSTSRSATSTPSCACRCGSRSSACSASSAVTSIYVTHDQVEAMTLADRLIVMNAGVADQIGTPMDVYDRPASVFVAGFIGSPAMNFLAAKVSADGRSVDLAGTGATRVTLPLGRPTSAPAGTAVALGIRPEHLPRRPTGRCGSRSSWPSRWAPTRCCTAASARRASW